MKRVFMMAFILGFVPSVMWSQVDDMYFVPTKKQKQAEKEYTQVQNHEVVVEYDGDEVRDVDEYNRRGENRGESWTYEPVDDASSVQDTVQQGAAAPVYEEEEPYTYSRRIIRFSTPGLMVASPFYWDLRYSYWDLYDDGYMITAYPYDWYDPFWGYSWGRPYFGSYWGWNYGWGYWGWNYGWGYPGHYHGWYHPHHHIHPIRPGGNYVVNRPSLTHRESGSLARGGARGSRYSSRPSATSRSGATSRPATMNRSSSRPSTVERSGARQSATSTRSGARQSTSRSYSAPSRSSSSSGYSGSSRSYSAPSRSSSSSFSAPSRGGSFSRGGGGGSFSRGGRR